MRVWGYERGTSAPSGGGGEGPVKATGWPGRKPRCGHVARVKAQIAEEPAGGSWREKPQLRRWEEVLGMPGGMEVIPNVVEWTPAESGDVWGVPGPTAFTKN